MPVYEFQCKCGQITEELVRMDTKTIECPKCHEQAKKIISACSFELKGGGWYADGYASTSGKAGTKSSGSAPACASGGGCSGCPASTAS